MAIGLLEKVSPTTYTQSVLARLFLWILMERFDFQFKKRSNFRCHIPGFTALWWNFPFCWPHLCHQPVLSPGRILVCYSILLNMSPVEIKGWGMGWSLTTGQFDSNTAETLHHILSSIFSYVRYNGRIFSYDRYNGQEYDISWTMPQCVLCLRLIGLFNCFFCCFHGTLFRIVMGCL